MSFPLYKVATRSVRDDTKFGTYASDVLNQMEFCVSNMVYSISEGELQQHADEFKVLACRDGRTTLWTYFDANWIACKELWVTLYRMDLPHFHNNTNNRLENFFGKLKADLESSMSMRQCLDAVIRYQRRKENKYVTRVITPGTQRHINYDEEGASFLA